MLVYRDETNRTRRAQSENGWRECEQRVLLRVGAQQGACQPDWPATGRDRAPGPRRTPVIVQI